jgi:hypothetical protein
MREIRSSGSAEGVMSNHDPYSDILMSRKMQGASYITIGTLALPLTSLLMALSLSDTQRTSMCPSVSPRPECYGWCR